MESNNKDDIKFKLDAANNAVSKIGQHMSGCSGPSQGGDQQPEADYEQIPKGISQLKEFSNNLRVLKLLNIPSSLGISPSSREVAFHIWAILPAAVLWVLWRTRNDAIFNEGEVVYDKTIQAIKAAVWSWLNISSRAMEAKQSLKFTDMLYGWRTVMYEQWGETRLQRIGKYIEDARRIEVIMVIKPMLSFWSKADEITKNIPFGHFMFFAFAANTSK
ncbi:hypothetical protein FRX31_026099, partial [Thalictrum thalictroides]